MLKKIFLSLIFMSLSTYCFAGGPLQSDRYIENNGGLVDRISPLLIPNKNASAIQNITLDDRGQLTKRLGYDLNNTTGALTTSAVLGGAYHNAASGSSFFGVAIGTNVYRTGNTFSGTYSLVTGTVTLTANSANLIQTTSLNDKLVFCSDLDKPFYLGSTGNAVHISTGLFTGAKTCTTYGVYLIIANTTESGTANPSRVRWSDINNVNAFPGLNFIDVEPNDGDAIVSVVAYEDSVYIFKKRSIHRMLITGLDGAEAFIIRPVARNIGAWAKNSVKVIPNVGITFLAQNTVYVLNDNGLDVIGDPIQRTLDSVTRTMWTNAVGAVYPKRFQYWLAVSTASNSMNQQVLVYDYIQGAWTLYNGMSVNMLAQAEDSTGQNILLSGDYSGNVYKQDTGTADEPLGVSTAISASYTTADLTIGAPEITKGFKYLYIFSEVDVNTTVTVEAAYDYASVYETSTSVSLGETGALYGTAIYGVDTYPAQQYKVSRIELNRSGRAVKLRFSNSSSGSLVGILGWVIVYQVEDYKQ